MLLLWECNYGDVTIELRDKKDIHFIDQALYTMSTPVPSIATELIK